MIIAVTGFGRCGTTLTMLMLRAIGIPLFYTQPYSWEHEGIKDLPRKTDWLTEHAAKNDTFAIKFLEPQTMTPPKGLPYRAIIMHRDPTEQAKSQLKLMGEPENRHNVRKISQGLRRDYPRLRKLWINLAGADNILEINFEELFARTRSAATCKLIASFVGLGSEAQLKMAPLIVNRSPRCYTGFLETQIYGVNPATD